MPPHHTPPPAPVAGPSVLAARRACSSETHQSQVSLYLSVLIYIFFRGHAQWDEDSPVTPCAVQCWSLLLSYHMANVNSHRISYHITCGGLDPVTPVGKMMSLFSSSYGHLKSRWGQMGRRCACSGRELIAWHGSTEHLRNQCSGKSIWVRASSYFVLFCQCQKRESLSYTQLILDEIDLSFHFAFPIFYFSQDALMLAKICKYDE